jgi:hypothetical protein
MAITAAVVAAQKPLTKVNKKRSIVNVDTLYSTLALGASGAITTQSEYASSGCLFELTAAEAGRYTVQVWKGYKELLFADAVIVGADDSALTDAKGVIEIVRDLDVGTGANDGTFECQFVQNTDLADDDVQDSLTVKFKFELRF